MNRSRSVSLFVLGLFSICCTTISKNVDNSTGFGYELLLAKLDYLEYKLQEQGESILESHEKLKRELLAQTSEILEQQKIFFNHEMFMNIKTNNSTLLSRQIPLKSCVEIKSKNSGRYWLTLSNSTNFEVYCEQTLHGCGWIVIQNRFNGSVNFFRNWTDYRDGFGSLDGEFWLGLEKIHQFTLTRTCELLIHLEDHAGAMKYARYARFAIGDESDKYSLKILESYNGTSGDSLSYHKGMKFSTQDEDNDDYSENCALLNHGGWWFKRCLYSNLNGPYKKGDNSDTMAWHHFYTKSRGLKVSKMMIREI